jgi:DNA-binding response OmpR family regulator/uncharacterized protein (DUF2225 family)
MEQNRKILIVDDVKAVHLLYRQALKDKNYEILDAERGSEALSLISKNSIDLLVLDLNLPDMDGTDILEKLREQNRDIPVIILTAYGLKERVIKTASYGVSYYLLKPVDLNMFRDRVEQVLRWHDEEKIMRLKRSSREFLSELSSLTKEDAGDEIVGLKQQIIELSEKIADSAEEESKTDLEEAMQLVEEMHGVDEKDDIELDDDGKIRCPVCSSKFFPYEYERETIDKLDPDDIIYELYLEIRNKFESMLVCPECLYAEEKSEFAEIPEREKERVLKRKSSRKDIAGVNDFANKRDHSLEILSYRMAANCYEARYKNNWYIGNMFVAAAFFAKNEESKHDEMQMLEYAARYYEDAYVTWEEEYGNYMRNQLIYFLVLVSLKLKHYEKAQTCIDTIQKSRELQAYPALEEAVNDKIEYLEKVRNS